MKQPRLHTRILRGLSNKLLLLSKRIDYFGCESEIFKHIDCLETIDALLKLTQPRYICDIGANAGHWTYVLQQVNPRLEHVVLFEPQQKYQQDLQKLSLPGVKKIIYPCGLGAKKERLSLKGGTASASFLPADQQFDFFPNSLDNEAEEVEIRLLDEIYENESLPTPDLIKIDVQGFELSVLNGGRMTLRKSSYLVIELSLRQFYKDQPSLWQILKFLEDNHFVMVGRGFEWRSWTNPAEIVQFDAIFMNNKLH